MDGRFDGGEALVEALRALEVEHIFCSSGSEWAPVWEAMTRQETGNHPGPVYRDFMHETLAVGMAIGFTLLTGKMQAVLLHALPGLLQGSNGIHGAFLANIPVLVMSSEAQTYGENQGVDPGSQWYRNLSFVGGPHAVADRYVKWSCEAPPVEALYEFVKRAGEIAQRLPRGPVYLNVPVETLLAPWDGPASDKRVARPGRRLAAESEVQAVAEAIAEAERPIVVTESIGRTPGGLASLVAFAEAYGLPVYEPRGTLACNFPQSHRLYQGKGLGRALDDADLVILVNCRAPWYPPSKMPGARIVVLDETPQRPQMVYQVLNADLYVEGEVPETLKSAAALAASPPAARIATAETAHDALIEKLKDAEDSGAETEGLNAVHCIARLRAALPDDAIVFDETITHTGAVQDHIGRESEGRYFYVQGGLGQGIGVALGGKLAAPERMVVLTVGDGSFLYNPIVQALTAAKEHGLPILIVVFNNRRYLSMQRNHLRFYPDGASKKHGIWHGVDLSAQPEIEGLAEPCGARGIAVHDRADLDDAIAEALRTVEGGQTCLLNLLVNE